MKNESQVTWKIMIEGDGDGLIRFTIHGQVRWRWIVAVAALITTIFGMYVAAAD